jgi:hypothetical protein
MKASNLIAVLTEAEPEIAEAIEASSTITAVIEAEEESDVLKALSISIAVTIEAVLVIAAAIG